MKKAITIFVLLLCLCSLQACAKQTAAPVQQDTAPAQQEIAPAQLDIAEISHRIYEANQLDRIFSRRRSATFSFNHPYAPDQDEVVWETAEHCFRSWSEHDAAYEKGEFSYRLNYDEAGNANLTCSVIYGDPYFYCFVGGTEKDFYNSETERKLDCHEENGLLYTITEYGETTARKALEAEGLEYTGQTVRTKMAADAQTYEIVDFCLYVPGDGDDTIIRSTHVEYDEPEPYAARVMSAAFERSSKNMIHVTYVIDPGTDHEIVRTITLPANTECGLPSLDEPFAYFYDADCTTLYPWDRMSDHTIFIITNPSEEVYDRFQAALEAAMR